MKPVVIIGGGYSGLISLKVCLEYGLDAVVLERLDHFGGLWRFRDGTNEAGIPSVMKTTIINTSKEMGALSDFPPAAHTPNYMHNSKMFEYLSQYVAQHKLESKVKFRHEVTDLQKHAQYEQNGEWTVTVRNNVDGSEEELGASAVLVCTGHHAHPNKPSFLGQAEFKGQVLHSHGLKHVEMLESKRVAVVGVGNSSMDVAAELSYLCKQVYLSTRNGVWIIPRIGKGGFPIDYTWSRVNQWVYDNFPNYVRGKMTNELNGWFDHSLYGLRPSHQFDQQHPSVSDIVPSRILAGAIVVKGDIARLTPTGAVFKGDEGQEVEVDAIVLCTGYNIRIPFLPEDSALPDSAPTKNDISLYDRLFPVQLSHPTLAFIGMVQPVGPLFPIMEIQARYICRLLTEGKSKYESVGWATSKEERAREVARYKESVARRYVNSQRHTIQVDYVAYMDQIAKKAGAYPNQWRLALTDPHLFYRINLGPLVSYQYRLDGPHKWEGARAAIMGVDERIRRGFGSGRGGHVTIEVPNPYKRYTVAFAVFCLFLAIVYKFFTF